MAVVASAAFDCAIFNYSSRDRWKVTARLTAVEFRSRCMRTVPGRLSAPKGTILQNRWTHRLRANTSFRHRQNRDHHPYSRPHYCQKYVVVPGGSTVSPWSGKVIDVMGDSNVAYQQMATSCRGRTGLHFSESRGRWSKIAKPDSSSTQISMPTCACESMLWIHRRRRGFCGPWATNDWAQNHSDWKYHRLSEYNHLRRFETSSLQKFAGAQPPNPFIPPGCTLFNGDMILHVQQHTVDG